MRSLRLLAIAGLVSGLGLGFASAEEFQDCEDCPVMVELPAGTFVAQPVR